MALTPGKGDLDGLELGGADTPYVLERLIAFGLSGLRTSTTPRPRADGSTGGPDYLGSRDVNGVVSIRDGISGGDLAAAADDLVAKFRPLRSGTIPFRYWRRGDDAPRRINVKPRRLGIEVDGYWWAHGLAQGVPFSLEALDPRWYADVVTSATLTLPTATTGRTYPRTYPLAYGGGSSGSLIVDNVGNAPTYPVVTIRGPVTNPGLVNATTGETIEFAIVLGAGEELVVDMQERTVLLGGTASRYSTISGTPSFWALEPGENDVRFTADAYDAAAEAEIVFRSAWLG